MANDNIFQQYLAPPKSIMDYSAELDQADARRQAYQQNALALAAGQQKFDEQQQATQRASQLRAALMGLPQGATDDQRMQAMRATGTPEGYAAADALSKSLMEQRKGTAAAGKDEADAATSAYKLKVTKHDQAIRDMSSFQTPQDALVSLRQHIASGEIPAEQAGLFEQQLTNMNPSDFPKWQLGMVQRLLTAKDDMSYRTPDANTVANNERIRAEGAANRANQLKVQQMIGDRQDAADAGTSSFTPEAIGNAADRYNVDGTLPPMGMGKAGSAGRAAILNEAARRKAAEGVSGTDQRIAQLGAKGEAQAKAASLRAYSAAGKEGQAIQATNTGLNHLDTIEQLAQAQKNGQTQLFNSIANKLAASTGQPAPTNLAAAITMVAPEVSKAVIGAAGGQEERANFARNFNPNGSPEQALQGIGVIKELMGGRLTEAQRTYERTTGRKDFRTTMLSPAAQRVLDKASHAGDGSGKPSLSDIFGNSP